MEAVLPSWWRTFVRGKSNSVFFEVFVMFVRSKDVLFFLFLSCIFLPSIVLSQVQYRGFQNTAIELTESSINVAGQGEPTENHWQENIHRVILWFTEEDDVTSYDEYMSYLMPQVEYFESVVQHFCDNGTKVNIVLYSTPGGFCSRGQDGNPSRLCIFENQELQDAYLEAWDVLSKRFAESSYRECLHGVAIANETAEGNAVSGIKGWNELFPEVIDIIRENDPDIEILVPAAYADPKRLHRMPFINDPKVTYVFHAYPSVKYSHSGIDNISTNINPPSDKALKNKIFKPIARMLDKWKKAQKRGKLEADFMPKFFASETTVTRMAKDADDYTRRLYAALENENADAGRSEEGAFKKRRCRKFKRSGNVPKFRRCKKANRLNKLIPEININGYISFPFRGAVDVFNPELPAGTGMTEVVLPNLTDRGEVVKEFFMKNLESDSES